MKKCALLLLACACVPGWGLDWSLPVFTLRYEHAGGASEDEEEQVLLPSSTRDTVSLRIREDAGPAVFGLTLRGSAKDYLLQVGDYTYLEAEQDSAVRLSDALRLGATLGAKNIAYPEPDAHGSPRIRSS